MSHAPFDGVVCDPTHLSAQNVVDGIHAVLSPSPSPTHSDPHAMEAVLSRTHAEAQGRQGVVGSHAEAQGVLASTHASLPRHRQVSLTRLMPPLMPKLSSLTHTNWQSERVRVRGAVSVCERERASESERSQSSERESASESERRERRERAPTHVTSHHACHGHSKEEARDRHWKEEAGEASGQEEARGDERRGRSGRWRAGRSRWPPGRFGDYAFAVCNLCQLRRLDCGCRDVSLP
jgi:hypothetical protein